MLDLIVVGAGQCGLALVCRLLEGPTAMRLPELSKGKMKGRHKRAVRSEPFQVDKAQSEQFWARTAVIDEHGDWCVQWNTFFESLQIPWLRSSLEAHADPYDVMALWGYLSAHPPTHPEVEGTREIEGMVRTREYKSSVRVPSTAGFHEFQEALLQRYRLHDRVTRGKVAELEPLPNGAGFRLRLTDGTALEARRVVLAVGQTHQTPESETGWSVQPECCGGSAAESARVIHAHQWVHMEASERQKWLEHRRLAVVGGGMTAHQLAVLAAKARQGRGLPAVKLLQRHMPHVRPFDVSLGWAALGSGTGAAYGRFASMKPDERWSFIESMRTTSITRDVQSQLEEVGEGVETVVGCMVVDVENSPTRGLRILPANAKPLEVDAVLLATGSQPNIGLENWAQLLLETRPIECLHGLPVLRQDLRWRADTEVYVMGAYASLSVGPDAANLAGARRAAALISQSILRSATTLSSSTSAGPLVIHPAKLAI